MSMLEVNELNVYYGVIQAIKGISFHVNEGEVCLLYTSPRQRYLVQDLVLRLDG